MKGREDWLCLPFWCSKYFSFINKILELEYSIQPSELKLYYVLVGQQIDIVKDWNSYIKRKPSSNSQFLGSKIIQMAALSRFSNTKDASKNRVPVSVRMTFHSSGLPFYAKAYFKTSNLIWYVTLFGGYFELFGRIPTAPLLTVNTVTIRLECAELFGQVRARSHQKRQHRLSILHQARDTDFIKLSKHKREILILNPCRKACIYIQVRISNGPSIIL